MQAGSIYVVLLFHMGLTEAIRCTAWDKRKVLQGFSYVSSTSVPLCVAPVSLHGSLGLLHHRVAKPLE
jgi:hypothetical protein